MIYNLHTPIMLNEVLSFIDDKKNLSILDCTFGGGGHSKKFLEKGGKLVFHLPKFHIVDKRNYKFYLKSNFKQLSYKY